MDQNEVIEILKEIDAVPLYKNSLIYESSDWVEYDKLTVKTAVQRKLTSRECVFDLDDVAPMHFEIIPAYLKETGLKFMAWQSGTSGMHIHFWTQVVGKNNKKAVVKYMSQKIVDMFGVANDLGPMGHECIRAEYSVHPAKRYEKTFLTSTMSELFQLNELPPGLLEKVSDLESTAGQKRSNNSEFKGRIPTCMKYILGHTFSDGRERMIFILVSWYKANNMSDQEIFENVYDWCKKQNYNFSTRHIWAKIKGSCGEVGCSYRHAVLEEIGVDMSRCKYE